jgi:DNA-binding MarR family transcriptional regulator
MDIANTSADGEAHDTNPLVTALSGHELIPLKEWQHLVAPASTSHLREAYDHLRRLSSSASDPSIYSDLVAATKTQLGDRRLSEAQTAIATEATSEPLRRRILAALVGGPMYPKALTELLGARSETISRVLGALSADGYVVFQSDPDDKRLRLYALTESGETRLAHHRSLLTQRAPERLEQGVVDKYLTDALDLAVDERRTTNQLSRSIERLTAIAREAEKAELPRLELRAQRELATTLRQDQRWTDFNEQLSELEKTGSGATAASPELVLPAYAHSKYEYGRWPGSVGGGNLAERARSLVAAADAYNDLGSLSEHDPASFGHDRWRLRHAWAVVSLADNFREQTELGKAIDHAKLAAQLFQAEGDTYGEASSLFVQGFSHRLRGQYETAASVLRQTFKLAEQHGYYRHRANSLLQLGDVERCLGKLDSAKEMLSEAITQAEQLGLGVTRGFALSALGSVYFKEGNFTEALRSLDAAELGFSNGELHQGKALNLRRMSVVQRHRDELATAADLAVEASRRYMPLHSPAGVATCAVTFAQVNIDRGQDQTTLCDNLVSFLANRRQRLLLELDPWFPPLLRDLAIRTDHQQLISESRLLIEDASARLYENDDEELIIPGVDAISTSKPKETVDHYEIDIFRGGSDEMAGEARRQADKVAA